MPRAAGPPSRGLLVGALLLAGGGCAMSFQTEPDVEQIERFTEPFHTGDRLELHNVGGRVAIRAWDRDEVEIVARKVGPSRAALGEIRVEIQRSSQGLQVRSRYPRRGRMWGKRYGHVHYSIRLPERADLRIAAVHGPVEVEGIAGEVEAQTVNGSLRLTRLGGRVSARTVNGRIECELSRADLERGGFEHSFRTVNGRVELTLGPGACGEVDAEALNGRVLLEMEHLRYLAAPSRRSKKAQVGEGGGQCQVRTVNGTIRVAAAGS